MRKRISEAQQQQPLYTTEWREQIDSGSSSAGAADGEASLLVLGVSAGSRARRSCEVHRQWVRTLAQPASQELPYVIPSAPQTGAQMPGQMHSSKHSPSYAIAAPAQSASQALP